MKYLLSFRALMAALLLCASESRAQLTPDGFRLPSPLTGNEIVDCQLPESPFFTTCTTKQIANLAGSAAAEVNVTDFGALTGACGNTVAMTANNTAIQAAFNSGKNVNFPAGNYPFKAQGFNIQTAGQKVHGPTCTGTGTASPVCSASIQDCSLQSDWPTDCAGTPADPCGYLNVYVTDVEIHDLSVIGNNPFGSGVSSLIHKGIFARGTTNNLYVHDTYVSNTNAESIYQDSISTGTRIVHNTVAHGQLSAINFNDYRITNAYVTDNYIFDQNVCLLIAADYVYLLRNICAGSAHTQGGDAINLVAPTFFVAAYNTVDGWNNNCCASSVFHLGFPGSTNITGPGVVAFNTLVNDGGAGAVGVGGGIEVEDVGGPAVIAYNVVKNNGLVGQPLYVGINVHGSRTDAVLITNNTLNGDANFQPTGIGVYSTVPMVNRVQVNNSNTFGTTPTQTQFLTAPAGAAMSVFQQAITKALAIIPDGLLNIGPYDAEAVTQFGTTTPTHVASGQPSTPAINSCSTGAVAAGSTDTVGKVTATGATTCSITWSVAYKTAPFCLVQDNTVNSRAIVATPSTTGLSVAGLTAADVFTYVCVAPSGG